MSFLIEIYCKGDLSSAHSIDEPAFTVGSEMSCDLIVPGAPALWFTCTFDPDTESLQTLIKAPDCTIDGQPADVGDIVDGRAKIAAGTNDVSVQIRRENEWAGTASIGALRRMAGGFVPRTAHNIWRRYRPENTFSRTVCVLMICSGLAATALPALLPMISQEFASGGTRAHTGSPTRTPAPKVDASLNQQAYRKNSYLSLAGHKLLESLARTGLDGKVAVSRRGEHLVIDGTLSAQESRTVARLVEDIARSSSITIENLTKAKSNGPKYQISAYGLRPQFVILADGQRAVPGDTLTGGWKLMRVGSRVLEVERDGLQSKISF